MSATDETAFDLDIHIERMLRGDDVRAGGEGQDGGEDSLVATARLLHAVLPRFHPRFGFEEALAGKLGSRAHALDDRQPIPFPVTAASERADDVRRVWDRYRRELVAGGAIASGVSIVIPLAGAAIVRWRRSRSSGTSGGLF